MSQEQARPSRVRYGGRRDDHSQKEPQGIDEEISFAAFDLFAAIITALPTQCCGLVTLAVETVRRGMLVAAIFLAYMGVQGVMNPLPVPAVASLAEQERAHKQHLQVTPDGSRKQGSKREQHCYNRYWQRWHGISSRQYPTSTPASTGVDVGCLGRLGLEGVCVQERLDRIPSGPTAGANGRERRAVGDVKCWMIERGPFVADALISESQHESHEGVFLGF